MGITGSQENSEKKPVVLIVGGGYAGVACAKALDKTKQFFTVLIDRKSYFLHNVAALRATVERDFARKILVPYDRLLVNGCVVQGEVTSITPTGVYIHGRNEPIHFDYLVIATGSSYAFPGKIAETESSKAIELYNNLREKIEKSQRILIIGGGPAGIELAGEIGTDYPTKDITLVHSQSQLVQPNLFHEKFYAQAQEQLEQLNVKLILNDRIELPNNQQFNYIDEQQTFVTKNSRTTITADLTFICTGARVNNKSLLNSPLRSRLNPQTGRLIVNGYLQLDGYEKIFAIGDICDKEAKMAYYGSNQGEYVAKVIVLIQQKKPYPKAYQTNPYPGMFVSIGRNGGIGQMPNKWGTIFGSFLVKLFKSKDMMTGRFRAALNYKSDTPSANKSGYLSKLDTIQSILTLTEQDARELLAGLPVKALEPGQDFI